MQVLPQTTSTDTTEFVGSVSAKGQITLPKPVRRVLGLKPKDQIAIRLEQGEVKVKKLAATFERIYRVVPPLKKPLTDKEMAHIAWEEQAQQAAQEGV